MQKISLDFENCYGIVALATKFDFTDRNQYVIYAPNGAMKSSFAKCFEDVANNQDSEDRVHPDKITKRLIKNENNDDIDAGSVFVVHPYSETYRSDRVSTLLANQSLREQYETVRAEIDDKKASLVKKLAKLSGIKKDTDKAFSKDISFDDESFFTSLNKLKYEVENGEYEYLDDIQYIQIFNDKTQEQLADDKFRSQIENYMDVYDELTDKSTFFRKGIFNHNNASDVAKNLKSNGFFEAEHSVFINDKDVGKKIENEKDLEAVIEQEKSTILSDPDLVNAFDKIDKILTKNVQMKNFRNYLAENSKILPELQILERFKNRLWVNYLVQNKSEYLELLESYENAKEEIDKIITEAKKESTRWAKVLEEFNNRFSVPFTVTMENQDDVILKKQAPSIAFRFNNADGTKTAIREDKLISILSNGEKRALYILNIIFEVEARRDDQIETLFIFDDIADSFDYKNKYAIVEYIRDITQEAIFFQIILTHNYDFYRTLSSRLDLKRENKLHAIKKPDGIILKQEKYQNNPFGYWKDQIPKNSNDNFLIAAVPFLRNLADYSGKKDLENELTKYLHFKTDSDKLTKGDLRQLVDQLIDYDEKLSFTDDDQNIFDLIYQMAEKAASLEEETIELESKIVLSIAIRLKAEQHMVERLGDNVNVDEIKKNQTYFLLRKYEENFGENDEKLPVIKKVNLMTPENIHLNSFMYEPILDMANVHLKKLFDEVKAL